MVCTAVTGDGTEVTVTTVTGDAPIPEVTFATWARSVTKDPKYIRKRNKRRKIISFKVMQEPEDTT